MKNKFQFYILAILCICLGTIFPFILPENFYFDSDTIVNHNSERGWSGSYPLTMMFYYITGLGLLPYWLIALIQLPILFLALRIIGIPEDFHVFTIKNCLVYISFFMIVAFIGQPSKELFTFLLVAFIVYLFQIRQLSLGVCLILSFSVLIFFGAVFRPYFMFIPLIASGIFLITKIKFKNRFLMGIFGGILVLVFLSFSHGLIKGKHLSEISREEANVGRMDNEFADTMILSPMDTSTMYGELFSSYYGFFTVNFPINGLKFFYKPQVVSFVIWQLLLSVILVIRFTYLLRDYPTRKKEFWITLFMLSYFIIQGIFEPDLGSAVRHKIGILPLIYFVLYYDKFKRKFL